MLRTIIGLCALVTMSGCVSQTNWAVIETAVSEFHARQARGEDQMIYEDAAPALRQSASLADLQRLNGAVRAVSGCGEPARDPAQWNSTQGTGGHLITVVYNRTCAGGPLVESFVFQMTGGGAKLQGYNVSGMALFPAAPTAAPQTETAPEPSAPSETPATATPT